jgi:DNA-binding protein HU-beta
MARRLPTPLVGGVEAIPTEKEVKGMNKTELTSAVAEKVGLSLKDARATVDAIFSTETKRGVIASELAAGRRVQITGFGTFETRKRKARAGRNPQTGEPLQIAASRYPAFHPGSALKERVRLKMKKG